MVNCGSHSDLIKGRNYFLIKNLILAQDFAANFS